MRTSRRATRGPAVVTGRTKDVPNLVAAVAPQTGKTGRRAANLAKIFGIFAEQTERRAFVWGGMMASERPAIPNVKISELSESHNLSLSVGLRSYLYLTLYEYEPNFQSRASHSFHDRAVVYLTRGV